jgi:hypothetical protein
MSFDYESSKKEISKILEHISDKHVWSEASFHLRMALRIINDLAKKESKKVNKSESQNWVLNNGKMMSPSEAKRAIQKIDNLIELESGKIKTNARNTQDDDMQSDDTTLID